MKIQIGDMFKEYNNVDNLLVTTNSILNNKGHLVMGAGAALQAKTMFKGIDKVFGFYINLHKVQGAIYGCVPCLYNKVGMFQTKIHYRNVSTVNIIEKSTNDLIKIASKNPSEIYHLNFPGVNHGRLTEVIVLPIIKSLPDNVIIWKYK